MLSFSLINETSGIDLLTGQEYETNDDFDPISPPRSFFFKNINKEPTTPDDNPPIESDKYVRDDLGDPIYSHGKPMEKSDIGFRGLMKAIVGPKAFNPPQSERISVDLNSMLFGKRQPVEKPDYDYGYNVHPEEQFR